MYDIGFKTATAGEILIRSWMCHPTLLADSLEVVAKMHVQAAAEMHDTCVAAAVRKMSRAPRAMA